MPGGFLPLARPCGTAVGPERPCMCAPSSTAPTGHAAMLSFLRRVINMSIHLLQDEDPDVRHEAAGFVSLVQHGRGQPGGDGCIFVQGNVGLLSLLQLLLDEFGHHPETFNSLLQHLPQPNLRAIIEDLEADT